MEELFLTKDILVMYLWPWIIWYEFMTKDILVCLYDQGYFSTLLMHTFLFTWAKSSHNSCALELMYPRPDYFNKSVLYRFIHVFFLCYRHIPHINMRINMFRINKLQIWQTLFQRIQNRNPTIVTFSLLVYTVTDSSVNLKAN